jgi:hypothetical protein
VRCLFWFSPPDQASRLFSPLCDYKAPPSPLAHDSHYILPSTLFCHRSLLFPVTGWAAQPPEFSPRDGISLTWFPLLIPPLSRLAALVHLFLEPSSLKRWSDSYVGVDAWPGQPGRSLPNPAPDPLPSLFPSASLNGFLSSLPRFLPV